MAESYKDLKVWQKSMDLAVEIYSLVRRLPKEEQYSLADQMRRAVVSIPSNIAEGKNRNSLKEFKQFLSIARGSVAELETQLILCNKINYLTEEETENAVKMCQEVGRMLYGLISSLSK